MRINLRIADFRVRKEKTGAERNVPWNNIEPNLILRAPRPGIQRKDKWFCLRIK